MATSVLSTVFPPADKHRTLEIGDAGDEVCA